VIRTNAWIDPRFVQEAIASDSRTHPWSQIQVQPQVSTELDPLGDLLVTLKRGATRLGQ
jgi:hypothetical protein